MEIMPRPITIAAIMAITLLCGINRATFAVVLYEGTITASSSASSTLSSVDFTALSCNFTTLASQRSIWASEDDSCIQKLPFNLWITMKAEGTANDPDAKDVEEQCIQTQELNLLELITPEDWDSSSLDEAPGKVVGETMHTTTFAYGGPLDFEAMCADVDIIAVNVVGSMLESRFSPRMRSRHLQMTTSEAVAVHKVTELIEGLQNLGCTRTNGEDTTLCVMSDSFNRKGQASALEASGDLPPVDVVKELPEDDPSTPLDEGSAMIELAYDIASGANYKFNTAFIGETAFADDIEILAGAEGCDVIVDDISYRDSPAFRDGPIATAVDTVADLGVLYFSSAGNNGYGARFTGIMECSTVITPESFGTDCDAGIGMIVWDEGATDDFDRYFLEIGGFLTVDTTLVLHWDDDDFAARALAFYVFEENIVTGSTQTYIGFTQTSRATTSVLLSSNAAMRYFVAVTQTDSTVEPVEMHLQTFGSSSLFGPTMEGGSMFGQACAAKAFSVAAMDWDVATGGDGAYADPETASVTDYSSRGPCVVSTGASLESRNHPVTTAATKLRTSSDGFLEFTGTSASAPVAAAIATLIRAACNPKVVTHSDIMDMLTDYDYTIDVTSDAGGSPETFGVDAGFGIISADQMLAWVATNCQESCPGLSSPPTSAPPTTAPPTTAPPTTGPPTTVPPTTAPPTTAPPTTAPPTTAPPTTAPPTTIPPTTAPPTTGPPTTVPPTTAPPTTVPPTTAPPTTAPPTTGPPTTAPPTTVPPTTAPPTTAPPTTAPPTTAPPTTTPPTTAPPTTGPPTSAPPTTAPPTTAPPTTAPPTTAPPTTAPPTTAPPTTAPPTTGPPTTVPPTTVPPTTAPPTTAPPTTTPPSTAPPTTARPTTVPPTTAPPTTAPPTTAPPTTAPPTTTPPTTAPPTAGPPTTVPPTTTPPTTEPPTTAPPTTSPPTTTPPTTTPPTTAPPTAGPPTTVPPTTTPPTTEPPTTAPPTTSPPTTAPPTTAPPTTVPPTTAPPTTAPPITAPPSTAPPTTTAPTTVPPTTAPPTTAPPTTVPPTTAAPPTTTPPTTVPPTTAPPVSTETCSNGVPGVERFNECCRLECGTCGGTGCSKRASTAGLEAEDCCVTRIRASGVYCDDSGTAPCIIHRDPSPTPSPVSGLVEAGTRTEVLVKANSFDSRTTGAGCAPNGCVAANTRDSSLSSRWSCKGDLLDGENCEIIFSFEESQDIVRIDIAFYQGTERTRLLEVEVNGSMNSEIESSGTTDGFENFELDANEVETVTLRSLDLGGNEWISLSEVQFMVL